MRKIIIATLLASTPLSTVLADDNNHLYGGFELGLTQSSENDLARTTDGLNLSTETNWGPVGGLYFGKKSGKNRFELEYLVRRNYFDEIEVSNAGATTLAGAGEYQAGGSQKTSSFMFNMWRTLAGGEDWSLLGGVGAGMSRVDLDYLRSGQNRLVNDREWAPALQAMAQIVKPIGTGLEVGLGYRFHHSFSADFETDLGSVDYSPSNHELFARISWRFGGEASKPAPTPAPIAAPAPIKPEVAAPAPRPEKPLTRPVEVEPAPLPQPYIVYFDFDKSNITTRAAQIIADAARGFREFKAIEIQTSGHTDRAGSLKYNEKLALTRVEAVRDALIREGVPADKIVIDSDGENSPHIATEDGVREDKNRRVEIKLVR